MSVGLTRALLIGINYFNTSYEVDYSSSIIHEIKAYIEANFPSCKLIRILEENTKLRPTRKCIFDSLEWLYKDLQDGQHVYFHFIGHGGHVFTSDNHIVTDIDKYIYSVNGQLIEKITEQEIKEYLIENIPEHSICFTVFDCCHAGISIPQPYLILAPSTDTILLKYMYDFKETQGQLIILSCFQDTNSLQQDVLEEDQRDFMGVLSMALLDIWFTFGHVLKVKDLLWSIQHYLQYNNFIQIPQLSCGKPLDVHSILDLNK